MMTMNAFGSFSWHVFILFVIVFRESSGGNVLYKTPHVSSGREVVVLNHRMRGQDLTLLPNHLVALAPSPVLTCLVTFFLWLYTLD